MFVAPAIEHIQQLQEFPVLTAAYDYNTIYLTRSLADQLHYPTVRVANMPCLALVEVQCVFDIEGADPADLLAAENPHPLHVVYGYVTDPYGNLACVKDGKVLSMLTRMVLQSMDVTL